MLVNGKSLFYEIGYVELSEKVTVFNKFMLLSKRSSSEELPASKKYMFWIITYSGEKALPKQWLCWKTIYLQKLQTTRHSEKYVSAKK